MIQSRFRDSRTEADICIQTNGSRDQKKRECWVVQHPQEIKEKTLWSICRRFAKGNGMKFLSGKIAAPYEVHTWQHEPMYVFEIECTKSTPLIYYEHGRY